MTGSEDAKFASCAATAAFVRQQHSLENRHQGWAGKLFFSRGGAGRGEARQKIYGTGRGGEPPLPHNAGRGGEGVKICGVGRVPRGVGRPSLLEK